jgi:hypothetical protein
MSEPLSLPPVNRDHDPLLCDHGVFAQFQGPQGVIELSVLCEQMVGHQGSHFAEGAGTWTDEDDSEIILPG